MEVEKRSSKGGFLQLFDWNLKSKKVFSDKSELSENSKQGKENVDGAAISRRQQIHGYVRSHDTYGESDLDYHNASSYSGDERYGAKAPGVVARLMGLDSLPTSTVSEPFNAPSFESESFRDSCYIRGTTDYQNEHYIVMYESMRDKLDGLARNPLELRLQKVQSRSIERFQSEVLPRKSAKPVSVTHNRFLSPIKSPGFIPPENAAYIIEAAAKIIEQSPRSTSRKSASFGSPSVPLRLQDLKEKIEAAQKSSKIPEASNKGKITKRHPREKDDQHLFKDYEASKVSPKNMKSKEKSVSLAVQPKSNVQKRDGFTSQGSRSLYQKQNIETKPSSISKNKNQPNTSKCIEKRTSSSRSWDVLKQNNQKQNCISSKDRESSKKPSAPRRNERKVASTSDMTRTNKVVKKIVVDTSVGSRETNPVAIEFKNGFSESRIKKFSGKGQPITLNDRSDRSLRSKEERNVKCNIAIEGNAKWDAIGRKSGTDVVSFTFTSPIKKLPPRSDSSQAIEKKKNMCLITCLGDKDTSLKYSTASSSGFNVVGGDALSVLLEQKLKVLTSRVEFSHQDLMEVQPLSSSSNSFLDSVSTLTSGNITSVHIEGLQYELPEDKSDILCSSNCSSYDEIEQRPTNWERREEMGEHSSCSNVEYEGDLDLLCLSRASSLEPFLSEASCNSFDSSEASDSKWCTTSATDEVSNWNSMRAPHLEDADLDLADSACSTSVVAIRGNTTTISIFTDFEKLCHWELKYIRDIISNTDYLMLEEFACGQVHQIIEPSLLDQLEIQITESNKNLDEPFKVARKALFDCVEECLELKCKHIFSRSFRAWDKLTALCQTTDRLAEDLYREIIGWTNMVDLMVDEVVDMDMTNRHGKWVEFQTETYEEGVEIEKEILSSLVDELFDDFSPF